MIIKRRHFGLSIVVASILIIGGCLNSPLEAQIRLTNQSTTTINTVKVEVNEQVFETQQIQPEKSYIWRFTPTTDASFKITGRFANGKEIKADSLGYTTHLDTFEHHFIVQKDGSVVQSLDEKKK